MQELSGKLKQYCENILQELWNSVPPGTAFILADGRRCTILTHGIWNHGRGPDFSGAVIRIGEEERHGDVELHRKASDWILHKHAGDPLYENVILHAVAENDTTPGNAAFLPPVPCLVLRRIRPDSEAVENTFCAGFFSHAGEEARKRFTESAGLDRMRQKSDLILGAAIRQGAWRAFFFRLMELLGLPGAREEFQNLAQKVAAYPDEVLQNHFPAVLWGESGLLPDPAAVALEGEAASLARALWDEWWKLRMDAGNPAELKNHARPLNSMERRMAAASIFTFQRVEQLWERMPEILSHEGSRRHFPESFDFLFENPCEFWEKHTSFTTPELKRKTLLIGSDRRHILLTDLVIPFMHARFRMQKQEALLEPLEQCFCELPGTPDNRILRIMQEKCFPDCEIPDSAAARQGIIHLYKTYCQPLAFQCRKCPLRNSLTS